MIPKKVGDKAFVQFVARCVMKDWTVLTPVGDCDRFDCVICKDGKLYTVQVKTGRLQKNGSIKFATCSNHYHTKKGQTTKHYKQSYVGQIDFFGVYCFDNNTCYLVPVDLVGKTEGYLRVTEPKRSQKYPVRWAKDYEI